MLIMLFACSTPSPALDESSGCTVSDFATMKAHVQQRVLLSSTGQAWVFSYPPVQHDGVKRPPAPGEKRYTAWIEGDAVKVEWEGGEATLQADRAEGAELPPAVRCYLGRER